MWTWLRKLSTAKNLTDMPHYRALRDTPARLLPADLQAMEGTEAHQAASQAFEQAFLTSRRPPDGEPLFVTLAGEGPGESIITIPASDGIALPSFSSPVDAFDYARTALAAQLTVQYLVSSPIQFATMLRDLASMGVDYLVLDGCPRGCPLTAFSTESIQTPDGVLTAWAIVKGMQTARAELYLEYALDSARAQRHEVAKEVLLESIGHVTMADPRPHFLLGRIGKVLGDHRLATEAAAFLQYLKVPAWAALVERPVPAGEAPLTVPWIGEHPADTT